MTVPLAVGNVGDIDIGKFLKIYSSNGVYNNLSQNSDMWKYFLKLKSRDPGGRQLKYLLRTGYGPSAVQSMSASLQGDYPTAQRSDLSEATAQYKDFGITVNIPRNLLNKTGNDLLQYADPLTEEMDAKMIVAGRIMSAQMQGDGTGVIGVLAATTLIDAVVTGQWTITLSTTSANAGRSHIGWFEEGDYIKFAAPGGTARTLTSAYGKVVAIDEDADTVTFEGSNITVTSIGALAAGDYCYRAGTTPADFTGITTAADYNGFSECMTGLESLTASDNRLVNGVNHTGIISGSIRDAGAAPIDSSDFQKAMSLCKRRAGRGRYKYKNAFMYDTVYDALVESRETDRRFQSVEDGKRGVKMLGYQHGADFIEFLPDEFVSKQRIWILPESKDVLEFHGKDFELVEVNAGQKFHLSTAASGAGHARSQSAYLEGSAVVVVKHAAAIGVIKNFTA